MNLSVGGTLFKRTQHHYDKDVGSCDISTILSEYSEHMNAWFEVFSYLDRNRLDIRQSSVGIAL